jgi:nucleotide-binding universal stress UspA family protein
LIEIKELTRLCCFYSNVAAAAALRGLGGTKKRGLFPFLGDYSSEFFHFHVMNEGEQAMIKTILVPTDGSGHAKKALDLATDLAQKYDARMIILHVLLRHASESDIEILCKENAMSDALGQKLKELRESTIQLAASSYDAGPISVPITDDILNDVGNQLLESASQRAEASGVKNVTTLILDGAPADSIAAAAEKENADMIVMGSRGLGNIAGLLMGSVSHKVSHLSKCTCITVK